MPINKASKLSDQRRFYQFLEKLSISLTTIAPAIWRELQTAYQQPHRKYHTFQHIGECLQLFEVGWDRAQMVGRRQATELEIPVTTQPDLHSEARDFYHHVVSHRIKAVTEAT